MKAINEAFPDANIVCYKAEINTLRSPDEKDRHVLASAIKSDADCIVTFKTRDLPTSCLKPFESQRSILTLLLRKS